MRNHRRFEDKELVLWTLIIAGLFCCYKMGEVAYCARP